MKLKRVFADGFYFYRSALSHQLTVSGTNSEVEKEDFPETL
jgi:hypothetical protein